MIKLHYNATNELQGFYIDDVHKLIPEPNIVITEMLWEALLKDDYIFKDVTIIKELKKDILDIEDLELFIIATRDIKDNTELPLNLRIEFLESENADLLIDSAIKDSRIKLLESDIADMMLEIALVRGVVK